MTVIPAPGRVAYQWSTWVLILIGVIDLGHVLLASLADLHLLTATQLGIANAAMAFVAGVLKLVQQQIALTDAQREALIASIEAAPRKGDGPQPAEQ
jgi:hypothetical protein